MSITPAATGSARQSPAIAPPPRWSAAITSRSRSTATTGHRHGSATSSGVTPSTTAPRRASVTYGAIDARSSAHGRSGGPTSAHCRTWRGQWSTTAMIECDVVRAAASPYLLASLLAGASQLSCSSKVCHLSTCGSLCTDLETDPDNCGTCGSACGDEQTCNAGKCTGGMPGSACTAPEVSCGDVCVNLSSSPGNCGACGSACHAFGEC